MQKVLIVFLCLGLVYVSIAVCFYVLQENLVYHPNHDVAYTPQDLGLVYDEVGLYTPDGMRLQVWYVPAAQAQGVVLFCHGNAGNIGYRLDTIRIIHELGFDVCIFDYRGYGNSSGKPTEQGTYADVETVWHWLVKERQIPRENIIVWGRSLGCAVATSLASFAQPRAFILESGFTRLSDIGSELYPWLPVRQLVRFRYPTIEHVSSVTVPVLVIHSPDDDLVPFRHGQALYQSVKGTKEFLKISGMHNHGFLDSEDMYKKGVADFLEAHTQGVIE